MNIRVENNSETPISASICIWDKGDTGYYTIAPGEDEHWSRVDPSKRGYLLVINPLDNNPKYEQLAYLVWPGQAYTWAASANGRLENRSTGKFESPVYSCAKPN
jgi:hypothetical protein